MSNFTPRSSQDLNRYFSNAPASMPQYTNSHTANYVYAGQNHYGVVNPAYSTCSAQYLSAYSNAGSYIPDSGQMSGQNLQARLPLRRPSELHPNQNPIHDSRNYSGTHTASGSTPMHSFVSIADHCHVTETESQESNSESQNSEPIIPPLEGFPNVQDFDSLMKAYISGLSAKKRDKALIHAERARKIRKVLTEPKTTSVETAQFRFWVKKMFKLCPDEPGVPTKQRKICHDKKPVAIREKLYKILSRAHEQCQHGGRDKTSVQVRRVYSWVPKELISKYVKMCPTCQARRGSSHLTPPSSGRSSPVIFSPTGPLYGPPTGMLSPPDSRRDSMARYHVSEPQSSMSSPTSFNVSGLPNHQYWLHAAANSQSQMAMQASHNHGSSTDYANMNSALGGTLPFNHSSVPSGSVSSSQYVGNYPQDQLVKREAY